MVPLTRFSGKKDVFLFRKNKNYCNKKGRSNEESRTKNLEGEGIGIDGRRGLDRNLRTCGGWGQKDLDERIS